jgi:hypothetical protein
MYLKKGQFAWDNGYTTFEEMLTWSTVVFSQYEESWLISPVENGFLAWVDPFYDQPLGYFKNYEEAEIFIDTLARSLSVLSLRFYGF